MEEKPKRRWLNLAMVVALLAAQAIPLGLAANSPFGWPGLLVALTANLSVLAASVSLLIPGLVRPITAFAVSCFIGIAIYVTRNPYVSFREDSFFLTGPALVLVGCLAGRQFVLPGFRKLTIRFSMRSLLFLIGLAAVVLFTEGLVAAYARKALAGEYKGQTWTWALLNYFIFTIQIAAVSVCAYWIMLQERRLLVAIIASALVTFLFTAVSIFCMLRGPFANAWDAVPTLLTWSGKFVLLQIPGLILSRWQHARALLKEPAPIQSSVMSPTVR